MGLFIILQELRFVNRLELFFKILIHFILLNNAAINGVQTYNSKLSSTYLNLGTAFSIKYGDGSSYSGTAFYDKLSISGATVKSQQMVQVTSGPLFKGDTVQICLNKNQPIT